MIERKYRKVLEIKNGAEWQANPMLHERSITPPLAFESSISSDHDTLSALIQDAVSKIDQRAKELSDLISALRHVNTTGISNVDSVIDHLHAECLNLVTKKDTVSLKYSAAIGAYDEYLGAHSSLGCIVRETYILDHTQLPVVRYGVNLESVRVESSGSVLGVSVDQITEDIASTSKKSGSSKPGSDKPSKGKLLHPLEIELLTSAINDLLSSTQKAVVVDIFDKEKDGSIKHKSGIPEIHAVVLYKQVIDVDGNGNPNFQIFVIDPSNSDFSKHLDNHVVEALISVSCTAITGGRWVDIVVPQKPLQIYPIPEGEQPGPNPDKFRDCVDLAIKLARGFNLMTEGLKVSFSLEKLASDTVYVSDLPVVQVVTNNRDINKNLVLEHKMLPLRGKQSTDTRSAEILYDLEVKIKAQKDLVKNEVQLASTKDGYAKILQDFANIAHDQLGAFINALKMYINNNVALLALPQHHPLVHEVISDSTQISGEAVTRDAASAA